MQDHILNVSHPILPSQGAVLDSGPGPASVFPAGAEGAASHSVGVSQGRSIAQQGSAGSHEVQGTLVSLGCCAECNSLVTIATPVWSMSALQKTQKQGLPLQCGHGRETLLFEEKGLLFIKLVFQSNRMATHQTDIQ